MLQQGVVVPLLNKASFIQNQNPVAGCRRGELVADHQDRPILLAANRAQDFGGGVVVDAGQGVIQHEQGRLNQQGSAQGGALALAATQGDPALPHQGVVAIGESAHVGGKPGLLGGLLHAGLISVGVPVAQVVSEGRSKEVTLLGYQGDLLAQLLKLERRDVGPIEKELPLGHLHHAAEGPGQGRFAAADRSDDRHELTGA